MRAYERFPLTGVEAFFYFVVREHGRAVAVLPVSLLRGVDPIGHLRPRYPVSAGDRGLLSHVWHCYDAWLPGAPHTAAVTSAVIGEMRALAAELGADWYGFINVPHTSPLRDALIAEGFPAEHIEYRFTVDLRGMTSADDYIAGARPRGRANLRRNGRRALEAGVTIRVMDTGEGDLMEVAELCAATTARHGTGAFYPPGLFADFVGALGDRACLVEVREDAKLVGVAVCLRDQTRFHAWACGVDYDTRANYSPYPILYTESVAQALREGRLVLEGGRSNHAFKLKHGLSPLPLDACLLHV
ncbi:GNAT family N-acetyltransferase [Sphaerisporangium album]|uniref:GNAT family N-acetyltransferase n=1 Tax=Sphaerisporangium album TaxID=509200 RepID=A0A367FNX6_9ACTN|nr:GNAT family N-acetyltransferase [Sphaerisporangium album]